MPEPSSPSQKPNPVLNRENLWAVLLCLALIVVFIMTADSAPLWIYQGF